MRGGLSQTSIVLSVHISKVHNIQALPSKDVVFARPATPIQSTLSERTPLQRQGEGADTFLKRGALGAIPSGEEAVSCHKSGVI